MMFLNILTILVAFNQADSERCPSELYSDEELQKALNTKCHLNKIYKEHRATHLHSHTRLPSEEQTRIKIFLREIRKVLQLRADPEVTWDVGLTRFADFTEDERDAMKTHRRNVTLNSRMVRQTSEMPFMTVPSSFDKWRENEHGVKMVAPVHEQTKKSSFAHAAVVPLESQLAFYKKSFKRLSVEELYHCAEGNSYGERYPNDCWMYVHRSGRLGSWYDSPESKVKKDFFRQEIHTCEGLEATTNYLEGYYIKKMYRVTSEHRAQQALNCVAPVVFQMDAKHNELESYKPLKNTLFRLRDSKCRRNDHAVAIVGYDRQKFIVKNSWGEDWGIRGYFYLDRSGSECEIFENAETPLLLRNDEDDLYQCRWK